MTPMAPVQARNARGAAMICPCPEDDLQGAEPESPGARCDHTRERSGQRRTSESRLPGAAVPEPLVDDVPGDSCRRKAGDAGRSLHCPLLRCVVNCRLLRPHAVFVRDGPAVLDPTASRINHPGLAIHDRTPGARTSGRSTMGGSARARRGHARNDPTAGVHDD